MSGLNKGAKKIYGVADKAWQVVVGCDPHMPCAPRCWARRTVARVVECQKGQHPDRAEFFQIALTPDGRKWSGEVRLDESHATDPLHWKKPALIATGFHGDWGRLPDTEKDRIFAVMALCGHHRFMPLTKQPAEVLQYMNSRRRLSGYWKAACPVGYTFEFVSPLDGKTYSLLPFPLLNVNIGCSVMNQADADKYRDSMREMAGMGWATHVWYEPAIGPIDWSGWEFLRGLISGGESGAGSRPSEARWHRDTRDWCIQHGIPFNFKQWGDWCDWDDLPQDVYRELDAAGESPSDSPIYVGKARAGRMLDGRTWDGIPAFGGSQP